MMLIETSGVPVAALPVAAFRDHLKLGTGFADDDLQDGVLEAYLRASLAAIEGRTGKVLFERAFTWVLGQWSDGQRQVLPVAPVKTIEAVRIVDAMEMATLVSPLSYGLRRDAHRPAIQTLGVCLPQVPEGGSIEIDLTAGFGVGWEDIPADLQQAVLLLAASYYERRAADDAAFPTAVSALIAGHRTLRITPGAAS